MGAVEVPSPCGRQQRRTALLRITVMGTQTTHVDLLALRNRLKRDPPAYYDDFVQQASHLDAQLELLRVQFSTFDASQTMDIESSNKAREGHFKSIASIVDFIAHSVVFYPGEPLAENFPGKLVEMLETWFDHLTPLLRKTLVHALIMLRNRSFITTMQIVPVFFRLFQCQDKQLRRMLYSHLVNDFARSKAKMDQKSNTGIRNYVFQLVQSASNASPETPIVVSRKAVAIAMDLYRRNVWSDDKAVSVLAEACFSHDRSITVGAMRFFIDARIRYSNAGVGDNSDSDQEDERLGHAKGKLKDIQLSRTKKSRKHAKALEKMRTKVKKAEENSGLLMDESEFGPIEQVFSPQKFAERLFRLLSASKKTFEDRLLMMNLLSRFIACFKLYIPNFYLFMQKYLKPHQKYVTQILSYCIQAVHDGVPVAEEGDMGGQEDPLGGVLKTLCREFVSDNSGPEVITVGLNSIRELCKRQPLIMTSTTLRDLVQYKKDRNKGVVTAARSLIGLFRVLNPELLHKKDRGKPDESADTPDEGEEAPDSEDGVESGDEMETDEDHVLIEPDSLEALAKTRRLAKEDRVEKKKEKLLFGARKPGGGTTNEEKKRLKPFQLTKYSRRVQNKMLTSQHTKEHTKATHIETMKSRNQHRRRRRRH